MSPGDKSPSEKAIQDEMVSFLGTLCWTVKSRREMNGIRRGRMGQAIVEPLLVDALQQINSGLSFAEAEHVAGIVGRTTSDRDLLRMLHEGVNVKFAPDEDARDIKLVDLSAPDNNSFVVTDEFAVETGAQREPRLDVVCLVNGLPLGQIENKKPTEELKVAAKDVANYWRDAPQLRTFGAVIGLCNGVHFVVGPSGAEHIGAYSQWKDTWPHPAPAGGEGDPMLLSLLGAFNPHSLIDLAANFVVFETREGRTTKKLARYQQFRAASKLVNRVVGIDHDRGVIWHTTGSGKSLTMVFAARKLERAGLDRPTILIVVDRIDLDDQIAGTFSACDYEGVTRVTSGSRLRELLAGGKRGVIVTIVNKFKAAADLLIDRENLIAFIDEAHRSQEGEFGIWMRSALPKAQLFGFTGTPIETSDRSTRRAFSPVIERREDGTEVYENYLDAYPIKQAIEDGATVAVVYEPRLPGWSIDGQDLDKLFDEAFADLDDEQREALRRDAARDRVVAHAPRRVAEIAADVADLLATKVAPFKAQMVAVDREGCSLYAEELAKHLEPNEFAVVMSRDIKKDDDSLRRWYAAEQYKRVHGAEAPAASEAATVEREEDEDWEDLPAGEKNAVRAFIKRFKNPEDPLRLLIVNNMLLTGFDAPIERALFLDRGLHDHTLLQAIARTNRTHPGKGHGIVFDYWGVLSSLDQALRTFSSDDIEMAATNTDVLAERFPAAVADALDVLDPMPAGLTPRRRMLWLVDFFSRHPKLADRFEDAYASALGAYETLAPDPRIAPHLDDYRRLVELRAVWRHGARIDAFDVSQYRSKTHALVQDAISDVVLERDLPTYTIDGTFLGELDKTDATPDEKATEIDTAMVEEIKARSDSDPVARSLAERLEQLRQQRAKHQQMTLDLLGKYEQLAKDYVDETEKAAASGLSERARALLVLSKAHANEVPEDVLETAARELDQLVAQIASFDGWQKRTDVRQELRREMIKQLASTLQTRPLVTSSFVEEAITALVASAERS